MKHLIWFLTIIVSTSTASALTLEEIAQDRSLKIQSSRGPAYRNELEIHALEEWEKVEDLYNVIDDGLIHDVYDGVCDPDVYQVDDILVEMDDWPKMRVVFQSIKKGSKSIAYVARPLVTYEVQYNVYKTHADYKKNLVTEMRIDCDVESEIGFYYEHNNKSEVIYMGYTYDLSEYASQELSKPKYGVLVDGLSVATEVGATALYESFKSAEDSEADLEVCYFGDWESAVESAHDSIEIGVIDIHSSGELEVEVLSKAQDDYTYGLIKVCN